MATDGAVYRTVDGATDGTCRRRHHRRSNAHREIDLFSNDCHHQRALARGRR